MSISSYYKSKKALFKKQGQEREIMLATGIDPLEIKEFHDEDYRAWKADRIYGNHNTEPLNIRVKKTDNQSDIEVSIGRIDMQSGGFLGSIESEKLYHALRGLKADDLALLEACVIKGVKQKEYAARIGRSCSSVNERLNRLLAYLKKIIK